jgi:hypothetical protein
VFAILSDLELVFKYKDLPDRYKKVLKPERLQTSTRNAFKFSTNDEWVVESNMTLEEQFTDILNWQLSQVTDIAWAPTLCQKCTGKGSIPWYYSQSILQIKSIHLMLPTLFFSGDCEQSCGVA